jgi:hypothetical protein
MVDDDSKRWRRTLTRAIHRRVSHVSTHGDHGDDNDDDEDDDDDDARDVRRSRAIAGSTGREIIVINASSRDDETKRALSGRERRTRPRVGASGIGWGNRNPGEPAHRIDADVE